MKTRCERCERSLAPEVRAYICSYECTFCETCAREMDGVCPNCSGELLIRPRRKKQSGEAGPTDEFTTVLTGQCHCGDVKIQVASTPEALTECNCSICRRYGAQWAYFTRNTAHVIHPPGTVSGYSWGDREIEFFHCNRCGCLTHYESVDKEDESRVAVNTRMFAETELADVPIRYFDGADSWEYQES